MAGCCGDPHCLCCGHTCDLPNQPNGLTEGDTTTCPECDAVWTFNGVTVDRWPLVGIRWTRSKGIA